MSISDYGAYPMEMKRRLEETNPYLPEELVIDEILTRLPLQTLTQYSCIIKAGAIFYKAGASFYSLDEDYKFRLQVTTTPPRTTELVGYCNGFACVTLMCKPISGRGIMIVVNPVKLETLSILYDYPNDVECIYLCHGFGFDSSTDEYKLVMIFITKDSAEFITMVFTLGTNSWRKVVTSVAQISTPPRCSPFPGRLATTTATVCWGDLFWRITSNNHNEVQDKIGALLTFDIHKEKIQIIRFPIECSLTPNQRTMNVVVEYHILEHKGYPCIARSEKTMRNIMHPCSHCDSCQSNCCCCCCSFTVQLYILKDKEKQGWIKGETFGVQVRELGLPPAPFCCYFDTTAGTYASFPTRILSASDQVLLHWFDGKCLKIYNLQTRLLEVVTSLSSHPISPCPSLFEVKMNQSPPANGVDNNGKIYCPQKDYQLHAQAENILSLKTFIPAGETRTFYGEDDFLQFLQFADIQTPAGWVNTLRELVKFRAFF